MVFLGQKIKVKVLYKRFEMSSFFDPVTNTIVIATGIIPRLVRKVMRRNDQWILAHEAAHAYLEQCSKPTRKALEEIFGSFSEEHYCGSFLRELGALFLGYNIYGWITPRSTLCPEEEFAEMFAYLVCEEKSRKSLPWFISLKLGMMEKIIKR